MKRLNHATKYTIFICIFLTVFNLIFGYVLIKVSSKSIRTQIDQRMQDISSTAAAMVNGDDLAKMTADDHDSPEYQRVMDTLTYFQNNIELEYIYCIRQIGEKEFVFGVDPTVEDPGEFGSPIVFTEALYNASQGIADVDDVSYEDRWGEFYSSYSPVLDSDGNVAGIVAIREAFGGNRIYRVGGDEFVAILDDSDPSERIKKVKATIDRKNKESPIFHNPGVEIGLSVGSATYDSSTDRTYSEVFNRADNAMYADKRAFYQNHEDRRKKRG